MTTPSPTPAAIGADVRETGCDRHHLIHCSQCAHDRMVQQLRDENEELHAAMSRACLFAWDNSKYSNGELDVVHPQFSFAFAKGFRAALASATQPPAGYVLAPVEPTYTQAKAAADAWLDCGSRLVLNKAHAAVRADIAAAPKAEPCIPIGYVLVDHGEEVSLQAPDGERWRYRASSGAGTDGDFLYRFLRSMLAAKAEPAQQPAPREPLTERQIVGCLVESSCVGTIKMSFDSGPYEITRPSINASRLVEAIEAAHGIKPAHKEQP